MVAWWTHWARALAAQPTPQGKARSVIMIFNCGGPSHIDLWDPKPDAGDNVRGPFATMSTKVPGIQVTELLPKMAKRMDQLAILRSIHHSHAQHNSGMYWTTAGRPYRIDNTLINPSATDLPGLGTLVGWLAERDGYSGAVPPYVITPYPHCDSNVYITPGQHGGCLGVRYDPYVLDADPNAANYQVRNLKLNDALTTGRVSERIELLNQLASGRAQLPNSTGSEMDVHNSRAASMILSGDAAKAFDLSQEPEKIRDKYGRHSWGQSHLLARRLIENGSRFVSTVNGRSIIWDTHIDNFNRMKKELVPPMEQAYDALLDDLQQRGLLETTLVLWIGDFGRTPVINAQAGRDHWPSCFSAVLAGGGIQGGQVVGASDATGAFPISRAITPADIHATIFHLLGYDAKRITYPSADGRPIQLSDGEVIKELV